MRIEVIVSAGMVWRWQLDVMRSLLDAGHHVRCRPGSRTMTSPPLLRWLLEMDALATRRPLPDTLRQMSVDDAIAALPVIDATNAAGDGAEVDVVLDLGSGRAHPEHLVLTFDGVSDPMAAVSAVLDGRAPVMAFTKNDVPVATALPALEAPHALGASLAMVFGRVADLAVIALRGNANSGSVAGNRGASGGMTAVAAVQFAVKSLAARVATRLDRLLRKGHVWQVGWTEQPLPAIPDQAAFDGAVFRWLADDTRRFYADPFGIRVAGRLHLFMEEFPYATQRGVISHAIWEDGRVLAPPEVVLERPYHLSYPFVFERDGVVFMIPETGANRSIELYRADPFPHRWTLERVLVSHVAASDATLLEHGGQSYLFATVAPPGLSTWDTLAIFHAADVFADWQPHPQNPVLVDAARARPAGAMFWSGDRLIRPVQDCVAGYGAALRFMQVDRLTPETFQQTDRSGVEPPSAWCGSGLHTFNRADHVAFVDRFAPPIATSER